MNRLAAILIIASLTAPGGVLASGAAKSDEPKASYFRLPAITANVRVPGGRKGVLQVDIGIDVADAKLRDHAELLQPRLRAAALEAVQAYALTLPPGMAPDADMLALRLQARTDQVVGKPGAKVLLGSITVN